MILHEIIHLVLSLTVAIVAYKYYRSVWVFVVSLISGFFLDADHLIDYFIYRHGFSFNLSEFASGDYFEKAGKLYLILHDYELVIFAMLGILIIRLMAQRAFKTTASLILLVVAASLTLHLLYDTIYYKPDWDTYSIVSRISCHFDLSEFHFH